MSRGDRDPAYRAAGACLTPTSVDAASLIARIENVPFSGWHAKARVIMGSATFFDAFNSLSLAFALPILIGLWHISPRQSGLLIASSYVGQLAGALFFSWLAETRKWLAGSALSLADFAAAAHLSTLDFIAELDWSISPPAKDWYARMKSRPSFRGILADRVSGTTPPAHYADLDF